MNKDTTDSNHSTQASSSDHPPIQWPSAPDAKSTSDNERAAHIVRQQVERAYSQREDNAAQSPTNHPHTMRNQQYDWQQYHNDWQQYYHQYFYRYYASWWQQQKAQMEAAAKEQASKEAPHQQNHTQQAFVAHELRGKVRASVEKRTKKIKQSTHFKPLLAAFLVGASFLLINYNQVLVGAVKQYVAPGSVVTTPVIVEPNASNMVGSEPKIIIPKIGVEAPVVYDEPKVDEASYQAALERGVVRLGNTANPGTKGNTVIGGHSSNNVFNDGKFKYVFVNLKRLDVGDIFYLNYQGTRYTYKITTAKKIIPPTETSVLAQTDTPTVTLFTCDPPGTNVNRLIVQAEQIDPSPSSAPANVNQQTETDTVNPLPSVAPSLWDKLFSWL